MSVDKICSAIIAGGLSNTDLGKVADALRFARSQLIKKNTGQLILGTKVKFTNSRTGAIVMGEVSKVNRKYIIVRAGATNWRVPANMLEKV
jgi:hypothetical protein